ncbi:hypothetical protein quinque_005487, partial [Culex quinquefasciatus]
CFEAVGRGERADGSGASESEIFIWDLNITAAPMSSGTKAQPFEDVQGLTWNRRVQHILASISSSCCVISVQLWDLHYATAPTKTFPIHQRGVQSVNKIADSFPGVDSIQHKPVHPFEGQPQLTCNDLKRPAGACFGFGSKLDTFYGTSRTVIVNQIVTDRELIERSNHLEQVLAEGTRSDACVRRNLKDCWETSRLDCTIYCDAGDI